MTTFVVYDNDGKIVYRMENMEDTGQNFTPKFVDVPIGKYLVGIDKGTKLPIFADIPKSEVELLREKLEAQEEIIEEQNAAMIEIFEFILSGGAM